MELGGTHSRGYSRIPQALLVYLASMTIRLQIKLDDFMEDNWIEWVQENGVELATLLFKKQTVKEVITASILPAAERKEGRAFMASFKSKIKLVKAAKKIRLEAIAAIKKEISESKAESKKLEKKLAGARIKESCQAVERILQKNGIDRGAHHGGDLVGGGCRLLMAKATAIFAKIQFLLLYIDPSESKASDVGIMQSLSCTTVASRKRKFKRLDTAGRTPNQQQVLSCSELVQGTRFALMRSVMVRTYQTHNLLWKRIKSLTTSFNMQSLK